jgi:hypothetical protein
MLQYIYSKSFIYQSGMSPKKINTQELKWKLVVLTLYWVSISFSHAMGWFMYSVNPILCTCWITKSLYYNTTHIWGKCWASNSSHWKPEIRGKNGPDQVSLHIHLKKILLISRLQNLITLLNWIKHISKFNLLLIWSSILLLGYSPPCTHTHFCFILYSVTVWWTLSRNAVVRSNELLMS